MRCAIRSARDGAIRAGSRECVRVLDALCAAADVAQCMELALTVALVLGIARGRHAQGAVARRYQLRHDLRQRAGSS
jgi:hypothetical protein